MESRALRYFVAVAEELNFARAAERLGISAPPLSRAIRKLEADLGVTLFERTTHNVELTPAGTVLLGEARIALDALQAAGRRAQRAAAQDAKLVLTLKADGDGGLLEPILARYATEPAALPVTIRLSGWGDQARLLRQGEADAALIYEPFDHTCLDSETITVERRLAALPATHPLAARDHLTLADLAIPGAEAGRLDGLAEYLAMIVERHCIADLPQLLTLVEVGEIVTLLPESVTTRYPRPGLAYREVPDAPPATLSIAWPQQSCSTATAALVRAATSLVPHVEAAA